MDEMKWGSGNGRLFSPESAHLIQADSRQILSIIARQAAEPPLGLEEIESPPRLSVQNSIDKILDVGWSRGGIILDLKTQTPPWDKLDRSTSFHLHSWHPLAYLLMGHSDYGEERYFDASLRYARLWLNEFQYNLLGLPLEATIDACVKPSEESRAWYDMAVSQRMYRLAYILDVLGRRDSSDPDELVKIFRSLVFHQEVISREEIYKSHNNHGLYQALGQLAAARRYRHVPGFGAYEHIATSRLRDIAGRMFLPSGAHAEHSPAYHYMVLGTFIGARNSLLIDDEDTLQVIHKAEQVFPWMIQPNGAFVPFGDTDYQPSYRHVRNAMRFDNPKARYALTGGADGVKPDEGLLGLLDAGYVFGRKYPSSDYNRSTYFAQHAGFHSRTHKHADHLSFVWMEDGRNILIDPGKYGYLGKTELGDDLSKAGYFYSDEKRIYVERTRSHNCIEIDGSDHQRKGAKTFGSALLHAEDQKGLWVTLCEVRYRSVRHIRSIVLRPGHFLLVVDWLKDGKDATHDFRQWFQLSPSWAAMTADGLLTAEHSKTGKKLRAASLLGDAELSNVQVGETMPDRQGWTSNGLHSLVPSPSFHWKILGRPRATFATLFSLSNRLEIRTTSVSQAMTQGKFSWVDDRGSHTLALNRVNSSIEAKLVNSETQQPNHNPHPPQCRVCSSALTAEEIEDFGPFCQEHGIERIQLEFEALNPSAP